MSPPHARTDVACRNCGAPAPSNFCGACGQETALHPPTLGEFVHEFVGHYVALEGALWRTLGLLLARPGRLTREYLDGRRRRYVLPLRLYLSASFLFFLVLKLVPSAVEQAALSGATARPAAVASSAPAIGAPVRVPPMSALRPVDCGEPGEAACNALERAVNRVGERFRGDPRGFVEHLRARLLGAAPYAVFLLLPVFAGIVALAYRARRMTYGEHVVFSLHVHAFWFLALLLVTLLPAGPARVLAWLVPAYGVAAMHAVYGGGWGSTLVRAAGVTLAYGLLLTVATSALTAVLLTMA